MRRTAPLTLMLVAVLSIPATDAPSASEGGGFLDNHVLVTWYGNPRSAQMGILGQLAGAERAEGLRRQAAAYAPFTSKRIVPAYHLVAVVAQATVGADGKCRRRETFDLMRGLLAEARSEGFRLVLDIQPGRAALGGELEYLRPMLAEPDVDLALDPEFDVTLEQRPGCQIGSMPAADINTALDVLDGLIESGSLPPKVLILHQFTLNMLPDKKKIRASTKVDVVLNMDGFGSQALKLSSYRMIMRQHALPFAGIKMFYRQDTQVFTPQQVMKLQPTPSVVIYQ